VVLEAVRLYVQGLSSYRILAALLEERLGRPVSRSTLNAWVDEIGSKAKTALEVSAELAPAWGGFLGVDGKSIWVAGEEACLLVGVDHPTQDIVHALVAGKEGGEEFAQLVTEAVLDAGYPLKGLVTDYGPGFVAAHHDHFSIVPLQLCRVHLDRRLDQAIPKAKRTDRAAVNAELKERVRSVLYAHSYEEACRRFYALFDERNRFAGAGPSDTIGVASLPLRAVYVPPPHPSSARRHQRGRERHQAARQEAQADGGVLEPWVGGTLLPAAGGLLPLQAVHRLLPC
jgi:hypothetical protein